MNDKARSFNRFLLYFALSSVLILIFTGCSMLSKLSKNSSGVSEKSANENKPKQWYVCKSGSDGKHWDCGSGLDEHKGRESASGAALEPENPPEKTYGARATESDIGKEVETIENQSGEGQENAEQGEEVPQAKTQGSAGRDERQAVYTVQIGAFAGEAKRDLFIEENGLQNLPLAFYESVKDGRTWWVLTHGKFVGANEAREASAKLARDFGLSDTWVRPLNQLKP